MNQSNNSFLSGTEDQFDEVESDVFKPSSKKVENDNEIRKNSNKKYGWWIFGALLIVGIIFLGFCWGKGNNWFNQQVLPVKLTPIKVALKWLHQAQFAGHYVADQKGYYVSQGLDVELIPFDYEHQPIDLVVSGQVGFGVAGADEVILARNEGKNIKAIAVIYQLSPAVAYTLSSNEISSIDDFRGKKLGMENSPNVRMVVEAMLIVNNIDPLVDVEQVEIGFDATELLTGKVDIATGYVINEPVYVEEAGYEVTTFSPIDYGIKVYADVLFTTNEMIENQSDLVSQFVSATIEGWEYALENVEEAVDYTLLYQNMNNGPLDYEHQKTLLERSIPLIKPPGANEIGKMNYVKWSQVFEMLRQSRLIENIENLKIEDVYTTIFSN